MAEKEIIEIDLFQFACLCRVIEESGEPSLVKLENGVLSSPGCNGDYGCCSESVDIKEFIESIKSQIPEPKPKAKKKKDEDLHVWNFCNRDALHRCTKCGLTHPYSEVVAGNSLPQSGCKGVDRS